MALPFTLSAQPKVENKKYGFMLKRMLSHSVSEISPEQVQRFNGWYILDTRTRKEFEVSKINGAHWVGYEDFKLSQTSHLNKDQPILLYCSVGYRSEKVGEKLQADGFKYVFNLYGGIFEWKNQGYPVYHKEKETEKVHGFSRMWGMWLTKGEKVF